MGSRMHSVSHKFGLLVLLVVVVVASGCCPPSPVDTAEPPQPIPVVDNACERAELRLERLDCRQADGSPWWTTPEGAPFSEACEVAMADGRQWHPELIACLVSCDDLIDAYRGKYACQPVTQ